MRWTASSFALAAMVVLAPAAAIAAPFGGPYDCVTDLIVAGKLDELSLARVSAEGQVHFQADYAGCPADEPRCLQKAYSVKGDVLVAGHRRGSWTCVEYPNRLGGTEGWVRSDQIAAAPAPPPPTAGDWAGEWVRDRDASIRLTVKGGLVAADGEALWRSPNPDNVHVGDLAGAARPSGDRLVLKSGDDPCVAALRRLGPYLVVSDNEQCGGANVTFAGVYRRAK